MNYLLFFIAVILIIFLIFVLIGMSFASKIGKKSGKVIQAMDQKYDNYIKKVITIQVLKKDEETDLTDLIEDLIVILRPEIEALVSLVNTNDMSDVKVKYESTYFRNIVTLLESFFHNLNIPKHRTLTDQEIEQLYNQVRQALRADFEIREIDLKMGKI